MWVRTMERFWKLVKVARGGDCLLLMRKQYGAFPDRAAAKPSQTSEVHDRDYKPIILRILALMM